MAEHILFLTGRLAEPSLERVLRRMAPRDFSYDILQLGLNVASLMTTPLVLRRLPDARGAARIIVPGRARVDTAALSRHYGIPVEHGPEELKDIPQHFGAARHKPDLGAYSVLIFAEIVEAPQLDVAQILARAADYRADGADVIDLGCLPGTPFPHLGEAVAALKREGYAVSVDSMEADELVCGARSGADYLLSLTEETLWIADEGEFTPVLIPATPGNMDSLERAIGAMQARGRRFLADPILDPIHFGFTESIVRYRDLRARLPAAPIMMGIGNLTELTGADTGGMNALMMGIISELGIEAVLTTQVSPHARSAVREADLARRVMHAAKRDHGLPKGLSEGLHMLHARNPFPDSAAEIAEVAAAIKDPSFRVQVSADGLHVYNRDGMRTDTDPFRIFPLLGLDNDGSHAFYMGVELARAQIAWQLGKRYSQDNELDWGCALRKAESGDADAGCAPHGAPDPDSKERKTGS